MTSSLSDGSLPALHSEDPEQEAFLEAVREANRDRNEVILTELKESVVVLKSHGIEPILLKGVALLTAGVYEDPGERYLADIDLLIPKNQLTESVAALSEAGWETIGEEDPFANYRHHAPPLRRPGKPQIELHWTLGPEEILPAKEVIARAKEGIPTPEDLVTHAVLHSQVQYSAYQRIYPPVRGMLDLHHLNRRYKINWESIANRFQTKRTLLALHLKDIQEYTRETLYQIPLNPIQKLQWNRRKLLRKYPLIRYADPNYMFSVTLTHRLKTLSNLLRTKQGIKSLLQNLTEPTLYQRLLEDMKEARTK